MKEVEKDIWLNLVIQHPEALYNYKIDLTAEAETIANNKFQTSFFREEDSKIFYKLLDAYYKFFFLFHGPIKELYEKHPKTFEDICEDFTKNFDFFFFKQEYERNFFWNIQF